ncbi:hypothetical protein GCM10010532_004820 [Dactylosporangium siamense]|uniref:Uncharacterized protein n=1 Tax=Dactylosporangium siamense TaxID=685454 RepID=A0A919PSI3_9ACTN|nr:hypothetical protein Dsi01nite_074050 [Dactylosporangium siamense]
MPRVELGLVREPVEDLRRHNAGVHTPEVAERAGHSVGVLPKVCIECIDGDMGAMEVMNATGPARRWPDQTPGAR